jgi:dimethylargininase
MSFTHAITREPGKDFASGLTTAKLGAPDYELTMAQHRAYVSILRSCGLSVEVLPPLPGFPDAYFVEDVAIITSEIAILTRPGAAARRGEEATVEEQLARYRPVDHIQAPGTVDGGDILQVGNRFFIGLSRRTDEEGARQLGQILRRNGNESTLIPVLGGLHLKSDVSYVGQNTLLISESLADHAAFSQFRKIIIDRGEAYAANSLLVNGQILTPRGFPRTKNKLLEAGFKVIEVETSEFRKMDGGLSCLSLRF